MEFLSVRNGVQIRYFMGIWILPPILISCPWLISYGMASAPRNQGTASGQKLRKLQGLCVGRLARR